MSMKFFSNIQDFLHLYNPSPIASSSSSLVEDSPQNSNTYPQNVEKNNGNSKIFNNNEDDNDDVMEHRRKTFGNNRDGSDLYYSAGPSASNAAAMTSECKGILRATSSYNNITDADLQQWRNGGSLSDGSADCGNTKRKSVQFPGDDNLVTGFHEPRKPSFLRRKISSEDANFLNLHEMLEAYLNACKKFKVSPSAKVEKQISTFHMFRGERQEILTLRGERMTHTHMDCLEEIFKRVQFNTVDFEYCFLDDEALISLSDMLEFYDSTNRLNLSFNQNIGVRGWQAFFRMIRKSSCLEHLNLRYTSLNERTVPLLARTLRTESSLLSLHLENCSLSGKSMLLLACAFKANTSIRDLYFAENNLTPSDAAHLYQIIMSNTAIELLDLRNNQLQDAGLAHICDALKNPEVQNKSKLNTLVLWNNRLTAQGMVHLARALLENKTLKTLNLGSNNIGSEGVAIIKDSLARNRSLLRLGLQATKINCQGAIAVAECIADNPMLIRVDLRDNPDIKSAGLLALHVALRMNTSILALNLDKSCSSTSSLKSKEHGDHFKKLFDEIHVFCQRNHDLMIEKLNKEEEAKNFALLESKDPTPEHPEPPDIVVLKEELICDSTVPEDSEISAKNLQVNGECPTETNMNKVNLRKISLTCKENVENLNERFRSMPRVEEIEEPANQEAKVPTVSVVDDKQVPANKVGNLPTAPIVIAENALVAKLQKRPDSLPIIPAAPRPSPRRFSVSKVDAAKKEAQLSAKPSSISAALNPARRVTIDYLPPSEDDKVEFVVKRLVSDLVNFCAYEAGELANTPCVPACQFLTPTILSEKIVEIPDQLNQKSTLSYPTDIIPSVEVVQLLDDLVRFVEYETEGGIPLTGSLKKSAIKKSKLLGSFSMSSSWSSSSIKCTDFVNPAKLVNSYSELSVVEKNTDTEINLAVREVVRDLVKTVCVQFDRKTAGRSSLLLRNRMKK